MRQGVAEFAGTTTRRFRCRNQNCERKIFAERIPSVTLNHGRQTWRLSETLRLIGYMLDLEAHRVIELLPDRSAQTLIRWLYAHPEVEVISRDRAGAYAEAAEKGAPQAIQVADRFHLMCNFSSAVERVVEQKMPLIREAMRRDCHSQQQEHETEAKPKPTAQARKDERRERRLKRYNETIAMYKRGMSQAEICRATGMEKKTVRRFLQAGVFPERAQPRRRPAQLDSFQLLSASPVFLPIEKPSANGPRVLSSRGAEGLRPLFAATGFINT